jgi:hypothetical protein
MTCKEKKKKEKKISEKWQQQNFKPEDKGQLGTGTQAGWSITILYQRKNYHICRDIRYKEIWSVIILEQLDIRMK